MDIDNQTRMVVLEKRLCPDPDTHQRNTLIHMV